MRTIHVLSIGNSFSEDAHRYLHDLSRCAETRIETVNLYIGGCSLGHHFRNMVADRREYVLEINGHRADGFWVSIKEALTARAWDVVTLQQASHYSYGEETFYPYINKLTECIRDICPKAKILVHQTWGYETGSKRLQDHGFRTYDEMFEQVKTTYQKAADCIHADGIIPSGAAFQYALLHGLESVHRDTFHAKFGVGRFILALVWYGYLTGNDVSGVKYNSFSEPVSEDEYRIAIEAAIYALHK